MHGTLKTTVGPPNLGINLPLSTKPTNANNTNNNNSSNYNNNKDGGNVNCQDRGEKKPSLSLLKKTNNNCSVDLKSPPSSGYTCGDCNSFFSSREVFVAHMRREHDKVNVWNIIWKISKWLNERHTMRTWCYWKIFSYLALSLSHTADTEEAPMSTVRQVLQFFPQSLPTQPSQTQGATQSLHLPVSTHWSFAWYMCNHANWTLVCAGIPISFQHCSGSSVGHAEQQQL